MNSVKAGDWVRYYNNGKLVLSEVVYVRKGEWPSDKHEALTLDGAVDVKRILEVRSREAA